MNVGKSITRMLLIGTIMACAALPAEAIDGQNLPTEYAGFLTASQANGTGWGDHQFVSEWGILVGSELDSLYMSVDAQNLWIGIPGNLPNKLAASQAFVILIDAEGGTPPNPNVLTTSLVEPYGGGATVLRYLDGTILEQGFNPETAIVVNRFAETTYVDSWYLPTQAKDPWNENLVSLDPDNGLYMSAWMDTTNIAGVDADETKDGPAQQALAATAVKGLRLRLGRVYFGIGTEIKIMVILASPGDNGGQPATYVSNQILPPLSTVDDPAAPACLTPPWPVNFDETYGTPPGYQGTQFAVVAMVGGTPTAFDGSNIPAQWPTSSLVATQQIHTCYGNAVYGQLEYTIEGSELDQLFVRADDQYLNIAVTGNLEGNGNKVGFFIDADPAIGENTMGDNSPPPPNATMIYGWRGRTFDDGFAPEFVYIANNWAGTLYVDAFRLLLADADVKQYQGWSLVNGTSGVLQGGDANPNNNEFILNHTNNAGVVSCYTPASPGDPATATSGLEARISLAELGVTAGQCRNIKVWVILAGGDSVYLSNMSLPSFTSTPETCASVGSYAPAPPEQNPFDFGEIDPLLRGHAAFAGNQYAGVDIFCLGACCTPSGGCTVTTQADCTGTWMGAGTTCTPNPCPGYCATCRADVNRDGVRNGRDVQDFVNCVIAGGISQPCACADMDGNGVVSMADLSPFVTALINTTGPCPP